MNDYSKICLEELEFSITTANELMHYELTSVDKLLKTSRYDLFARGCFRPRHFLELLDVLLHAGVHLEDLHEFANQTTISVDIPPTDVFDGSWGCLYAYASEPVVRDVLVQVFAAGGLRLSEQMESDDTNSDVDATEYYEDGIRENSNPNLEPDQILLIPQSDNWTGVFSRAFEIAPVGHHPLAMALSKNIETISIRNTKDEFSELSVYRQGRWVECDCRGPKAPKTTNVAPVDFHALAEKTDAPVNIIQAYRGNLRFVTSVLGWDYTSFREILELGAFDKDSFLFFVR